MTGDRGEFAAAARGWEMLARGGRLGVMPDPAVVADYEIELYEDERGDAPVLRWLREELSPRKRRALDT